MKPSSFTENPLGFRLNGVTRVVEVGVAFFV